MSRDIPCGPLTDPGDVTLREVVAIARRLAGDELEVLLFVARRLDVGRARYGALDVRRDRRDFPGEALEELAHAAVYLGAALLRARKGRAPR